MSSYHPTLWRTCRALMNANRLACLGVVVAEPGLTVGEIAMKAGIPLNQTSMNLRLLQSRGLLTSVRESRWLRYLPQADPLVKHADAVLNAVSDALLSARTNRHAVVLSILRAFTHPRRLTLLACLKRGNPLTVEQFAALTDISAPAVWRHLRKLHGANLVCPDADPEDARWTLPPENTRCLFASALLKLL